MEFNPNNPIVKLCLQGMAMEEAGKVAEALELFMQAWEQGSNDFERFLAAHYIARQQSQLHDKVSWLHKALDCALKFPDLSVQTALPGLYRQLAAAYEALHNSGQAKLFLDEAQKVEKKLDDKGPFYHGTRAHLQIGDALVPGKNSNYQEELIMNHIYFTALINGAGLAAALAQGEGLERVYIVEPTGEFENDPNVSDKKFPGNPTRSYRTALPLKIVGEATEWQRISAEELQAWRQRLAANKGKIIN